MFDSLTHPTLSGTWLDKPSDNTFDKLVASMRENGIDRAAAVGISGVDGHAAEDFIRKCQDYPELVPVAGVDPLEPNIETILKIYRDLGYKGIKIHPRFSNVRFETHDEELGNLCRQAGALGLVVFLCTYCHAPLAHYPEMDPLHALVPILKLAPDTKVVLLHGGDVNLLRFAELVRFSDNLLLDLSFTMLKYRGSSLETDMRFLSRTLDRKLCVGSDHPEFSHRGFIDQFDRLTNGLSEEKRRNISDINLTKLLDLE